LTYFGEPTGQGGCQFSVARNRKGDKLRECASYQERQETNPGKSSTVVDNTSYEPLPSSVWATAWGELYKLYSQRFDQDNIDLMESVFNAVLADYQDETIHGTPRSTQTV
jgi:hypothetical protein